MGHPQEQPPGSGHGEGATTAGSDRQVAATSSPGALSRSRVGVAWVGLVLGAVVLVLLLIFVAQNGRAVEISFLGAEGHLPLGVALLLAAVAGALIVAVPGSLRILQLRRIALRGPAKRAGTARPAADTGPDQLPAA